MSVKPGLAQANLIVFFLLALALLIVAVLAFLVAYATGTYRRASQLLSQWATRNGYRIIESDRRYIRKGPFFWTSSQSQIIYHVSVQDAYGNTVTSDGSTMTVPIDPSTTTFALA